MPTQVKICGLSDEEGVDAALDAGADFVGLVLFPPSPRNVSLQRAAILAARARPKAIVTVLTVDADDRLIGAIAETVRPDLLQFHGKETPPRVAEVHARFGIPVMKALGIARSSDLAVAPAYGGERLLLDAKPPRDATRPGGLGVTFDWSLLEGFAWPGAWFLSGGLAPENVGEALAVTGAPAVDVSSGVESAPGRKEPSRIHEFVQVVRSFDRQIAARDKERAA